MSDSDRSTTTVVRDSSGGGGGGLYFIVGALVVAVLIGGWVLMGMPGLHGQVASAPTNQKIDVTVQQPAAPATPAPATPAPRR